MIIFGINKQNYFKSRSILPSQTSIHKTNIKLYGSKAMEYKYPVCKHKRVNNSAVFVPSYCSTEILFRRLVRFAREIPAFLWVNTEHTSCGLKLIFAHFMKISKDFHMNSHGIACCHHLF